MNTLLTPEIREIMKAVHYRPAVSIIMPFEPKMGLKNELRHSLKIAADKVELDLLTNYPDVLAKPVMQKLRSIIGTLNFNTFKKSIAIFISPVFEKVLYLDIPVEEKIIIDESFEIRDLVYCKKQLHKYLVLLLSNKESRIYLGDTNSFVKLVSDSSWSVGSGDNKVPEHVANFSDKSYAREVSMHKFLNHIDNTLDIILHAYPLPLFILGTERIAGHFKSLTKHTTSIVEYVPGNYEEAGFPELIKVLEPYINDWKKVREKDLLNQLEDALGKKKLAVGMEEVWYEAVHHKGRLLVVEKNYMYAAQPGSSEDAISPVTESYSPFSYIQDAVDDVIERVLENGGDIEFVDENVLQDYQHIALIKYY